MTTSRITQPMMANQAFRNLQSSMERLSVLQDQAASGKQIRRPSDSPVGTVSAMRFRGELARNAQYVRNVNDGLGWLGSADHALSSADDQLRRVRDLVIGGQNGALSAQDRAAMADEVEALRASLIQLANTTYLGRPIFGGTTDGAVAYGSDGTFLGDAGVVTRTIGTGDTVPISVAGPRVFGDDDTGIFALLDQVAAHLRHDPQALTGDLAHLDGLVAEIRSAQSTVGVNTQRLEGARAQLEAKEVDLRENLSFVEDVDFARVALDLNIQMVAYQTALAVTGNVLQPSLVEFLR